MLTDFIKLRGFENRAESNLGISIDEANFWRPPTVETFATTGACETAFAGAELLTPTYAEATEENPYPIPTWSSRSLSSQEITEIVSRLFSRI